DEVVTQVAPPEKGVNLYREGAQSPLQVKLDGRIFHTVNELTPRFRAELEEMALDFYKWLGYALPSLGVSQGEAVEMGTALPQVVGSNAVPALTVDSLTPPEPRAKSIVSQINDILQDKVVGSPYSGINIRLVESPSKGIVVQVGLDQYPEVEDVPDPAVRQLIQSAVSEWEHHSS
ncbi:MAG TPA: hypothetical protein VHO48_05050, partial [Anaerolineaceae bacterium]|nr:hypothetical protein [Anaerolineaceae bacterium]